MISENVVLGDGVTIPQPQLVNLYGCRVGDNTKIGAFVEIQSDAVIGKNCKISSHSFICSGVTIGDGVFVGHGVMFINDLFPQAVTADEVVVSAVPAGAIVAGVPAGVLRYATQSVTSSR